MSVDTPSGSGASIAAVGPTEIAPTGHHGDPPRLRELALAAIAATAAAPSGRTEDTLLARALARTKASGRSLADLVGDCVRGPSPADEPLVRLGVHLQLSELEVLLVALAAAAEDDVLTGRILAHVQSPIGGSRPTLGLICQAFATAFERREPVLPELMKGAAFATGLLTVIDEKAPLAEQAVAIPAPLCLALAGEDGQWAGATIGIDERLRIPLAPSTLQAARRHAAALDGSDGRTLVIRAGSSSEGKSVAAVIARSMDRRSVFLESDRLAGIGSWLVLRGLLPVFCQELGPGELRRLPRLAGYGGPVLVLAGADGSIESPAGAAATWTLPLPTRDERRILWWAALGDDELAREIGDQSRHGAGRIAHLGRLAQHQSALSGREQPNRQDVYDASWSGEGAGLDALAQPVRTQVPDEALIATPRLREQLKSLLLRCRLRDELATDLGIAARTRYVPGVRALFTGPSGTGKTLAAAWIATRMGLPLYRVELSAVSSKYIGETEKNLSQLLARAEQAEVVLLFDEADSLFGKRTDVKDSNDRFANAQTNYLLQRIESYDGIVLLTSNSQARFDPAFARRLDFTIEFSMPGPEERRALWQSHLGEHTCLQLAELNQLAVLVDLSGGHIRNAVLAAAVRARQAQRPISFDDVLDSVASELTKLGRHMPVDLLSSR